MLDIFLERFRQKKRTVPFPATLPQLLPRFLGRPFIDADRCTSVNGGACDACVKACPLQAVSIQDNSPVLDMGRCVFCGACARACTAEALVFTTDWRLASTDREALLVRPATYVSAPDSPVSQSLPERPNRRFALPELPIVPTTAAGGTFMLSFRLRQVTAAGCGACEADLNVLGTIVFDLMRFGIDFVASPRHADGLVLTGPVPRNMREALIKCRNAMSSPKVVLAVGSCAISGGPFRSLEHSPNLQRAEGVMPHMEADIFIPGCPPHPYTSLDAMLKFIGRKVPVPQVPGM